MVVIATRADNTPTILSDIQDAIYASILFVEIARKAESRFVQDDALPKGTQETCDVTYQLNKSFNNGKQTDIYAFVPQARIRQNEQPISRQQYCRHDSEPIDGNNQSDDNTKQQYRNTQGEHCRQAMHQFQRGRIFLIKIDASNTGIVHLLEELAESGSPFMPHPGFGKQKALTACRENTDTQSISKTQGAKAIQSTKHIMRIPKLKLRDKTCPSSFYHQRIPRRKRSIA